MPESRAVGASEAPEGEAPRTRSERMPRWHPRTSGDGHGQPRASLTRREKRRATQRRQDAFAWPKVTMMAEPMKMKTPPTSTGQGTGCRWKSQAKIATKSG